jgi:hypothetical protein
MGDAKEQGNVSETTTNELLGETTDLLRKLLFRMRYGEPTPPRRTPPTTTGERIAAETVENYMEVVGHALPRSPAEADNIRHYIAAAIDKAIAAEREACAGVADTAANAAPADYGGMPKAMAQDIAEVIRDRKHRK